MRVFSFRNLRIAILLIILAMVAIYLQDQRLVTQGWYRTLNVVIYPINVGNNATVARYIRSLEDKDFADIDKFLKVQSEEFNLLSTELTKTRLGETLQQSPPPPPPPGSNALVNVAWGLKLRYWIWQNAPAESDSQYLVRIFVNYHEPIANKQLPHSVGIQKGLIGVVNAFGVRSQHSQNNIIIAHELLHTVGASDKYDGGGLPIHPDGLGNPNQSPLYPQRKAEIMAGRRALSPTRAELPASLRSVVIGKKTADEIGWLKDF